MPNIPPRASAGFFLFSPSSHAIAWSYPYTKGRRPLPFFSSLPLPYAQAIARRAKALGSLRGTDAEGEEADGGTYTDGTGDLRRSKEARGVPGRRPYAVWAGAAPTSSMPPLTKINRAYAPPGLPKKIKPLIEPGWPL